MKKALIAITFTTIYLILFQASPYLGFSDGLIIGMYLFSPILVIAMVYSVLKNGEPSKYTFDERFYEDLNYTRNGIEDLN